MKQAFSRFSSRGLVAGIGIGLSILGQAAWSATCQSIDPTDGGAIHHLNAGGFLTVTMAPGEVLTITPDFGPGIVSSPFRLSGPGFTDAGDLSAVARYTATADGMARLSTRGGAGDFDVTCTTVKPASAAGSAIVMGAEISGVTQSEATATGVGLNSQSRFGQSQSSVQRNRFFLGTAGRANAPDWNIWTSAEFRMLEGGLDGQAADLVMGVDRKLGENVLIGALLAYGVLDISNGTDTAQAQSLAFGPYLAVDTNGLTIDSFLTFARPEYETTLGNFTATRRTTGLSLTGDVERGGWGLSPSLSYLAFVEEQPAVGTAAANRIVSKTLSASIKLEAKAGFLGGDLAPYFSIGLDHGRWESTSAGISRFTAPRYGLGLGGTLGIGDLTIDIDAGRLRADTRDIGIRARYEIAF